MARSFWQRLFSERSLLDFFFRLRGLMLIASVGAILGAILMFGLGGYHLLHAFQTLIGAPHDAAAAVAATKVGKAQVVVYVLEAVDAFLFALVLMIFAYGIALGFVFHHVSERYRDYLPEWMLVEGVGQLKRTLAEVVIVVLIVIFARLVIESAGSLKWEMLVLPLSVLMLSFALRLLHHSEAHSGTGEASAPLKSMGLTGLGAETAGDDAAHDDEPPGMVKRSSAVKRKAKFGTAARPKRPPSPAPQ